MTRKNFPSHKNFRRKIALENWEKRLKLSDSELWDDTKKFKEEYRPSEDVSRKLSRHRKFMINQVNILKEKIKVHH